MVGEKVVLRTRMSAGDAHYAGELVEGAHIVTAWGDVGTELAIRLFGDESLFLGYSEVRYTHPVYSGDFMEYSGWIEKVGNTSLTPGNWTKNVDCIKSMDPKNQNIEYWFVAMGESPLGSGHAFSAVHPLKYPSNTPPQVIALSTEIDTDKSPVTNKYAEALNKKYTGTVQINFSSYLYYLHPDTKKILQVVDKPITAVLPAGYVSSQALITSKNVTSTFIDKDRTDNPLRDSLILSFTNLTSNGTITFTGLAKKDGVAAGGALTLRMVLEKDTEGYYIPRFYITDVVWDATTGGSLTYKPKK